jgi:predicted metalloprotease
MPRRSHWPALVRPVEPSGPLLVIGANRTIFPAGAVEGALCRFGRCGIRRAIRSVSPGIRFRLRRNRETLAGYGLPMNRSRMHDEKQLYL